MLPGIGSSGPEHWQTRWERLDPTLVRVQQAEWDAPRCADWVQTLDAAIAAATAPVILVAHSSACALVAHWVKQTAGAPGIRVGGALLVGPSDPTGPHYPVGPTGFAPVPLVRLPFPSIVVASTDDIYVSLEQAAAYARAWGSRLENVGARGHINSASGLGDWPEGRAWLDELRRGMA
ncbi:MAG: alpha/beta hydrolase [Gemmatimonadetes bacterium]|nr:alpha/beta hydrolase [Gemmatimonadota bacterium]